MWNKYIPGETPNRRIRVSPELKNAIDDFINDKGCTIQHLFDASLITLWRKYNGNTESNEPANRITEKQVREILENNPMPGNKKKESIYIAFRGEKTFQWVLKVEKLYMCDGVMDFVRRSISYYLRKKGYLDDDIAQKIPNNQT